MSSQSTKSQRDWQVGRYYQVPAVLASIDFVTDWYVILGTWHEDAEHLNFPSHHYHLDLRFAQPRLFVRDSPSQHPASIAVTDIIEGPVTKRRKMRRRMPVFPATNKIHAQQINKTRERRGATFPLLVHAYRDSRLTAHGHCPHKGMDLSGINPVNGIVVCPLHGLCFDAESGKALDPLQCDHLLLDQSASEALTAASQHGTIPLRHDAPNPNPAPEQRGTHGGERQAGQTAPAKN